MYIYTYIYIYTCIYTYKYYAYTHMHTYTHTHIRIYIYLSIYIYMYTYVHNHTLIHMCNMRFGAPASFEAMVRYETPNGEEEPYYLDKAGGREVTQLGLSRAELADSAPRQKGA